MNWAGVDVTSGVASCTSLTYGGPDSASAPLSGACRDNAGNVSAALGVTLAYDATPPSLSGLTASGGDTTASLAWKPSADTQSVSVVRAPGAPGAAPRAVYSGAPATSLLDQGLTNGVKYTYTVTAFDAAGNAASQSVAVTPFSMLVAPLPNSVISRAKTKKNPPTFTWQPRTGANYYNFQLYLYIHKHWRKVLSKWPSKNHYQLHRAWSYGGKRRHLIAGHYRWYVWPGYGRLSRHRYGKLLGTRDFFVVR